MPINEKKLEKAAKILMSLGPVPHKRPPKPTKKDLQRKFKMRVDRKGNPSIEEVE